MGLLADLPEQLAAALADEVRDVAVTRSTPGGGDPWNPNPPTVTHFTGKGWRDQYTASEIDGTVIRQDDVRVFILATSIATEPTPADTVTIDGKTYAIISVKVDPAGAAYELQGRSA